MNAWTVRLRVSMVKHVIKPKITIMDKTQDELDQMDWIQYGNTGTRAYFDGKYYYNNSGQLLRDLIEYDPHQEGYTPFGDE